MRPKRSGWWAATSILGARCWPLEFCFGSGRRCREEAALSLPRAADAQAASRRENTRGHQVWTRSWATTSPANGIDAHDATALQHSLRSACTSTSMRAAVRNCARRSQSARDLAAVLDVRGAETLAQIPL